MLTRIQRWGNSQGVRLSKDTLAEAGLAIDEMVDVGVRDGVVTLTPSRRVQGSIDLDGVLSQLPPDWEPDVIDWGPPAGREVW